MKPLKRTAMWIAIQHALVQIRYDWWQTQQAKDAR